MSKLSLAASEDCLGRFVARIPATQAAVVAASVALSEAESEAAARPDDPATADRLRHAREALCHARSVARNLHGTIASYRAMIERDNGNVERADRPKAAAKNRSKLAREAKSVDRAFDAAQRRINRGVRRTSGRIV